MRIVSLYRKSYEPEERLRGHFVEGTAGVVVDGAPYLAAFDGGGVEITEENTHLSMALTWERIGQRTQELLVLGRWIGPEEMNGYAKRIAELIDAGRYVEPDVLEELRAEATETEKLPSEPPAPSPEGPSAPVSPVPGMRSIVIDLREGEVYELKETTEPLPETNPQIASANDSSESGELPDAEKEPAAHDVREAPERANTAAVRSHPEPVFFVDWETAQADFDLQLYGDGDVIGYDKNGVEYKAGRSGSLSYATGTDAFWGGNAVPGAIHDQINAYLAGELTAERVRESYLEALSRFEETQERAAPGLPSLMVSVFFDEKPDVEKRAKLKACGFIWAPTQDAWQRQLTDNAIYSAGRLDFIRPLDGRTVRDHQPKAPVRDGGDR